MLRENGLGLRLVGFRMQVWAIHGHVNVSSSFRGVAESAERLQYGVSLMAQTSQATSGN